MRATLIALTLAAAMNVQSATLSFASPETQTSLLELYTSEGCSSCPPADAWFTQLTQSPRLWKDFVPVAFHIDYWDRLGWRDPWSSSRFSDRQRALAKRWHSDAIYTPAAVLNGVEWRDWNEHQKGPEPSSLKVGYLTVTSTDTNHWQGGFIAAGAKTGSFELHAALLIGHVNSNVKAGENQGRRLRHDFVATSLEEVPLLGDGAGARGEFTVVVPKTAPGQTLAIAAWVTQKGRIEPLQATGGWIIPPSAH